jgi:hypothetical protein
MLRWEQWYAFRITKRPLSARPIFHKPDEITREYRRVFDDPVFLDPITCSFAEGALGPRGILG